MIDCYTNLTSVIGHCESLGPLWSKPVEKQLLVKKIGKFGHKIMISLTTKLTRLKMLARYK